MPLRIGSGKAPHIHRNHPRWASVGLRASSALSSENAALPPSIRVAPIARLQAAIVHSSMQVAPCQPNISISRIEKPTETSAVRRVSSPAISPVRDQLGTAEQDHGGVEQPEVMQQESDQVIGAEQC